MALAKSSSFGITPHKDTLAETIFGVLCW